MKDPHQRIYMAIAGVKGIALKNGEHDTPRGQRYHREFRIETDQGLVVLDLFSRHEEGLILRK